MTPIFWTGGSCVGRRVGRRGSLGLWTGREILLYLIMYRKYVRKWLLLKKNRIIWSEIAVKFSEICPAKFIFCEITLKIEIFWKV